MAIDVQIRQGVRSRGNANPRLLEDDITQKIHELDPVPGLAYLSKKIGRGPAPKSPKVEVVRADMWSPFDRAQVIAVGGATDGPGGTNGARFARIQISPRFQRTMRSTSWWHPQQKLKVYANDEVWEVWMTDQACFRDRTGADVALGQTLVGNGATTNRTRPGEIIVRNVQPFGIRTFNGLSDIAWLGRVQYEGQEFNPPTAHEDVYFDVNFVETIDAAFDMTRDQKDLYKTKGFFNDFTWQQKRMLRRFQLQKEELLAFGKRASNFDIPGQPTYHMDGYIEQILRGGNVQFYNPASTTNFETLIQDFITNHAFLYNDLAVKSRKIMFVGQALHARIMRTFSSFRRDNKLEGSKKAGLQLETYVFGNHELGIMPITMLERDSQWTNWGVVMEPSQVEMRVAIDDEGKDLTYARDRIYKFGIEWAGTVCLHRPEMHAILRTA